MRNTDLARLWVAIILPACAILSCAPNTKPPNNAAKHARQHRTKVVELTLGEQVASIDGFEWPTPVRNWDMQGFDYPVRMTIRLPHDRVISGEMKTAFIEAKDERVVSVNLTPLPAAVPFRKAVEESRAIYEGLRVASGDPVWKRLDKLESENPSPRNDYNSHVELPGRADVFIAIKHHDGVNAWYIDCEITDLNLLKSNSADSR